jgi:hypothetical protein
MSLSSPKILRGAAFLAVVAFTALPAVAQVTDEPPPKRCVMTDHETETRAANCRRGLSLACPQSTRRVADQSASSFLRSVNSVESISPLA